MKTLNMLNIAVLISILYIMYMYINEYTYTGTMNDVAILHVICSDNKPYNKATFFSNFSMYQGILYILLKYELCTASCALLTIIFKDKIIKCIWTCLDEI